MFKEVLSYSKNIAYEITVWSSYFFWMGIISVLLSLISFLGGLTIGVPGKVKGLYYASRKFGRLPWKHLVEPAKYLAKNDFHIPARLSAITRVKKTHSREI